MRRIVRQGHSDYLLLLLEKFWKVCLLLFRAMHVIDISTLLIIRVVAHSPCVHFAHGSNSIAIFGY